MSKTNWHIRAGRLVAALVLVMSLTLVVTAPVAAQDWLDGWTYRIRIVIDSDKIDDPLTHFPVLLRLGSSVGITGADVTSVFNELGSDYKKMAITRSDGITQLYCEVERWDETNRLAELWVSASDFVIAQDTDTVLYLYYDGSRADNTAYVGDTGSTPAQNAWDSGFRGVWHKHDADGSAGAVKDSTPNDYHGTKTDVGEPANADGKIGRAQDYDGVDDYVEVAWDAITGTQARTVSFWIKPGGSPLATTESHFVDWGPNNVGERYSIRVHDAAGNNTLRVQVQNGYKYGTTVLSQDQWYHAAVVFPESSTDVVDHLLYVNGQLEAVGDQSSRTMNTVATVLRFARSVGLPDRYGKGALDEVRISNVARSAAWIKAEYHAGDDSLLTYERFEAAVATATGTGWAYFAPSHGAIEDLTALMPLQSPRHVIFPHGLFSFRITGLHTGQTVAIDIELPEAMPAGSRWWKCHDPDWYDLSINMPEASVITVTLTDGVFPGDLDIVAGQITDPGGPGYRQSPAVGGTALPPDKLPMLLPWLGLVAIAAGTSLLVLRRRRAQSY